MKEAYKFATRYSTDPSTNLGAVIVSPEGEFLSGDANRFPEGVKETKERWERPLKYHYVEHAERNAIYSAAADGMSTYEATMYCPWFACADCARAIIQCGIKKVVGHKFMMDGTPDRWRESIDEAHKMLTEAGVEWEFIDCKIGDIKILFNGEWVFP